MIEDNQNKEMCSACGGWCCKRYPGLYSPEDIGEITVSKILDLLNSGTFSIDYWIGGIYGRGGDTPFLRPRKVGEPVIDKRSWGEIPCINLTETGCSLEFKHRPIQCRELVPNYDFLNKENNCSPADETNSKENLVKLWFPYRKILHQAVQKFSNSNNIKQNTKYEHGISRN